MSLKIIEPVKVGLAILIITSHAYSLDYWLNILVVS